MNSLRNHHIFINNEERKKVVMVRGAPAVGKTTVLREVATEMKSAGLRSTVLHWDDFFHLTQPVHFSNKLAIEVTRAMVKVTEVLGRTEHTDIVLLDGVFILSEEQDIINTLSTDFELIRIRLICGEGEQLRRNLARDPTDYLEENRIKLLNSSAWNVQSMSNEILLSSDGVSKEKLAKTIIWHCTRRNIENNR